ncbi:MATE family efflux transporter [Paenibacillus sp. P32E]|uniref:MATE family efflux transporter n=1 Tax=Paenibacillus sp. P32E TaxID=1349434 RepID=UPI00093912EB|nr:MATE family efflux transporter [Paenibacillus sp. P32E]OKP94481.1 MATE family efflux transporter [Paenibacillus sp. P32E]
MSESNNSIEKAGGGLSDEILRGPIAPTSIKLAVPVIIGQLMLLGYGITNTVFISMIDKSSTALMTGIGLVFPIHMCFLAMSLGLFTGMSSIVARGIGEKNKQVTDRAAGSGIWLAVGLALFSIAVIYLFSDNILPFLSGSQMSEEALNNGLTYLHWILPGLGMMLVFQTLLGVLQGEGLSKYYGMAMLLSTVVNIILDPIFIFGLNMGVAGAALATTISITVSLLFVINLFRSKKSSLPVNWKARHVERSVIGKIAYIGLPQTLSMISLSVASAVINNLMGSISEHAMNSWIIVGRIDELLLLAGYGFGSAALTQIGQNYGSGNMSRVLSIFKTNVLLSLALCIVLVLIYNGLAPFIFSMLTGVSDVVEGAVRQVRIVSFSYLGVVAAIVVTSSFQATGRAMPGLILDILRMGLLTIPVSYMLFYWYDAGATGIFYAMAAINLVMMVFALGWCYLYLNKLKQSTGLTEAMAFK